MNKFIQGFIVVIISSALIPLGINSLNNTSCSAFAQTDTIFFTAPVGSDPTYDGGMRFNGDFGDNQNIYGFNIVDHPSWIGKRLSEISINLSIEGATTGNLKIGVFQNNGPTYTVRSLFLTQDVTLLSTYPSWTNIVATGDYVIQSDDIIGIKADGVHTLNDITGVHIQLNGDVAGFSMWNDNANDGPITGIPNAVGELHELVAPIPPTPNQLQQTNCGVINAILPILILLVLIMILFVLINIYKKKNN